MNATRMPRATPPSTPPFLAMRWLWSATRRRRRSRTRSGCRNTRTQTFQSLRQSILANRPSYPELEKLTLTFSLTKLREILGPDDPFVRKILGKKSPEELAKELVDGSKLGDVAVRKALLEGGQAAVDASSDPMIAMARSVDPDFRAVRKDYEDNFAAPLNKAHSAIAKARFKIFETSMYPDATFTMRISYGTVKGYWQDNKFIEPITRIGGLFERATGAPPLSIAGELDRCEGRAQYGSAHELRDHKRHYRRQLRLASDQQGG